MCTKCEICTLVDTTYNKYKEKHPYNPKMAPLGEQDMGGTMAPHMNKT